MTPGQRSTLSVRTPLLLACALLAGGWSPVIAAESLKAALEESTPILDLRYRLEVVDQDGFEDRAVASTLRARVGIRTGELRHFYGLFDAEVLRSVGSDRYNSTNNDRTDFPVVPDPEDTEVNQVFLGYTGLEGTDFRLGRQRIALDNHRFIGNVGWRQLEQTFDAFSVQSDLGKRYSVFYGRINNVNRVFGEHNEVPSRADTNMTTDLLNGSIDTPWGKGVGYVYLQENDTVPDVSHKDIGVRFTGKHAISDRLSILYTGELADQSDYRDGDSFIDARYHLIEAGIEISGVTGKAGYEVLGGDGVYAFFTPLATLHAFNGWADVFAADTPADGLVDIYGIVSGSVAGIELKAVYHDFSADEGGADYGTELDLLVSKSFSSTYSALIKYADYSADDFATDVWKIWIQLGLKL